MTIMMVAISGIAFVSCGDNDDEPELSSVNRDKDLVGTWIETEKWDAVTLYYGFLFENDGKGYYNEWNSYDKKSLKDGDIFNWTASDGTLKIGNKEEYTYVLSPDKKTLTLYKPNGVVRELQKK